MKVRCIELIDISGNRQEQSSWLTLGKTYYVLEVVQDVHRRWLLRLVGDTHPGVGLFPLRQFEILSSRIPNTWIVSWNKEGVFELTTKPWSQPDFWERFYNHESGAIRIFEEERAKIIADDP
jgi:hypothetical protein